MVLPVLDYCDIVFHECGQENQDELEHLQRRASRIVYHNSGLLSTNDIIDKLGWETPHQRRSHLESGTKCIDNEVPNCMSDYFKIKRKDIHDYNMRHCEDLVLDKVKLECTKHAFFYKGFKAKIHSSVNH